MCVCERERETQRERKREREKEKERERERERVSVCVYDVFFSKAIFLPLFNRSGPPWREHAGNNVLAVFA